MDLAFGEVEFIFSDLLFSLKLPEDKTFRSVPICVHTHFDHGKYPHSKMSNSALHTPEGSQRRQV